jgi:hypothetical protein
MTAISCLVGLAAYELLGNWDSVTPASQSALDA